MIDAQIDILASALFLLYEASRQGSTPSINDRSTLFSLDGGMKTQILPTCEAERPELLFLAELLGPVFHQ